MAGNKGWESRGFRPLYPKVQAARSRGKEEKPLPPESYVHVDEKNNLWIVTSLATLFKSSEEYLLVGTYENVLDAKRIISHDAPEGLP